MNRDQSDTIYFVALNRLTVNIFVPFCDKGIDVARIVGKIIVYLVVKGANICTLFIQSVELENVVEFFDEVKQRHSERYTVGR